MDVRLAIAALALSAAPACLEHETDITVEEDGSVSVTLAVRGDAADLRDGFPVPVEGPWWSEDELSDDWLTLADPEAWVDEIRQWYGDWADIAELELRLHGRFDDARELPTFYAPHDDPYRESALEHETSVETLAKGGRRIYVFERRYGARDPIFRRAEALAEERLVWVPGNVWKKLKDDEPLTPDEWDVFAALLADVYRQVCEMLVREALSPLYTRGDASLSVVGAKRIVREAARAVADSLDGASFVAAQEQARAGSGVGVDPFEMADARGRQALRESLASGLDREGVPWTTRNAVLLEAEQLLSAWNATSDLRDETFRVRVRMPGVIIGGNYEELDQGSAAWSFDGEDLLVGEKLLRVVSVVE